MNRAPSTFPQAFFTVITLLCSHESMPQTVAFNIGGVRWEVGHPYRDQLFGPNGLRLAEWLGTGQAQIVKEGPQRIVYRVELPGLKCYLKHNRVPDLRAQLRQLVRPSKARMEYQRAQALAALHVPTVVPLALGEPVGPGPGDSFIITRSLEETLPLHTFLETRLPDYPLSRQARIRQAIAQGLGVFMARLHQAGIVHPDLHCGNLLVRLDPEDRADLYLIDLHAVRLTRPLGWQACRQNLVILNRWFVMKANRSDRLRFWKSYVGFLGDSGSSEEKSISTTGPQSCKDNARGLEWLTWESNEKFWRRRDRRCLNSNRYYQCLRTKGIVGHAVRDLDREALAALVADPDAPFLQPHVQLLKDSPSSTVAEFDWPVHGAVRRVIYKRFRINAWQDPWVNLLRRSPALRSWVFGHGLRERGLPTARPLVVFHRTRCGFRYEGYLVTEKIPNALDLRGFVEGTNCLNSLARLTRLRQQIDNLGRLVRGLHRTRLSQRDLKAANILVQERDSLPNLFWLIDLAGISCHRKLGRKRRVQNLTRLHASFIQNPLLTRSDKLRFLRAYLQWGLYGRTGWKEWWRAIAGATQAKIDRNTRNSRPLA